MAKFYGAIGYLESSETSPGVWTNKIVRRNYYGDVIRNTRKWENASGLNDNIVINNQISVIGDCYAYQNISAIRCIDWMGATWKVTNVEIQSPRLVLTIGGVYNE